MLKVNKGRKIYDQFFHPNLARNPGGGHCRKMWVGVRGALLEALILFQNKIQAILPIL